MKNIIMLSAKTQQKMEMILTIVFYEKKHQLHHKTHFYKRNFAEMVYIKKEGSNSINKITDIENLNKSYNMLLDLFS